MSTEVAGAEQLGFLMPFKSTSEGRGTQQKLGFSFVTFIYKIIPPISYDFCEDENKACANAAQPYTSLQIPL